MDVKVESGIREPVYVLRTARHVDSFDGNKMDTLHIYQQIVTRSK